MKKLIAALLAAAILAGGAGVYAAGVLDGTSLVSLDYLKNMFLPDAAEQAEQRVETGTQGVYDAALSDLEDRQEGYLAQAGTAGDRTYSPALADLRFKKGDVITLSAGSGWMPLAGSFRLSASGPAVVDVTAGTTVPSGGAMTARHRYLAGENTTAALTVASDTAVLALEGYYTVTDGGGVDYNALAGALFDLGLFQGSGTAYGGGYDLEVAAARVTGVVMFLRLIGEEEAALASTAENPFADTPAWCDRYVAYAYEKGYTNGVGDAADGRLLFAPERPMTAGEYVTLILRALGYSDSGAAPEFTWNTALEKSVDFGVLSSGERAMLEQGDFLRAQMVYVSYFALNAPARGGGVLLDRVLSGGGLTAEQARAVMERVDVPRM